MYDLILVNATIPQDNNTLTTNILVKEGLIVGMMADISGLEAKERIDLSHYLTLPGCIDSHTHFMDPGFTHRETVVSGSRAAAAGGISTFIDMPCCSKPSVRSVASLNSKLNAIKERSVIDFALWGGLTGEDVRNNQLHHVEEQKEAGVVAFKVYMTPSVPTYPRVTDAEMLECFRAVAPTGLPLGVHAENFDLCQHHVEKFKAEGRLDGPAWSEARLTLAEKVAIELGISFAEETGARYHVVHMSSGIGAHLIGEAKKRGLSVTSEVCPHYLTLNYQEAMSRYGSFAKIAPPLRTIKDNQQLWEGLRNGSVDFVATDHAPYEIATEKKAEGTDIWSAMPGIPGVETMVPVIISEGYNQGRLSLKRLVEVLSSNAAKHYGLYPKKGAIAIGSDADFTVIDLNRKWTIDQDQQESLAKFTPLHGLSLKGKAVKTIVRGKLVYEDGKGVLVQPGYGQFIKRQNISKLERTFTF